MMYRMQVITDDGQYEMFAPSIMEGTERFKKEKGVDCLVAFAGTYPDWLTLKYWQRACEKMGSEEEASILVWSIDVKLGKIADGLCLPGN